MSLFDICHPEYSLNLLKLACIDSEKDHLNLSMSKIRQCYDLTGVWRQDRELLYSLFQIAKFCYDYPNLQWWSYDEYDVDEILEEDEDDYYGEYISPDDPNHPQNIYQPLVDYFYSFIEKSPYADKFLTIAFFLESPLWCGVEDDGKAHFLKSRLCNIKDYPNQALRDKYPRSKTLIINSEQDLIYLESMELCYASNRVNSISNFVIQSRFNKSIYYYLDIQEASSGKYKFEYNIHEDPYGYNWSEETLEFNVQNKDQFKLFAKDFYKKAQVLKYNL